MRGKRSQREKFLIIITVSIIAVCIIYFFIYEPIYKKWQELDEKIDISLRKLATMRRFDDPSILSRFRKLAEDLTLPGQAEEQRAYILEEITALAEAVGIPSRNIKPMPLSSEEDFLIILFKMDTECTLTSLTAFLKGLQQMSSLIDIDHLQITPLRSRNEEKKLRVNMRIARLTTIEKN